MRMCCTGVIDEPTALDDWRLPFLKKEQGTRILGITFFTALWILYVARCALHAAAETISLQLNVHFCAPARRHKVTRNILTSVFLVACDTDRSHQKAQAEKTNRNTYALPPLPSCCCSLLSHKCGWVFGLNMHVVRIRLTGANTFDACNGDWDFAPPHS